MNEVRTPPERSALMKRVRQKNTKPEPLVRSALILLCPRAERQRTGATPQMAQKPALVVEAWQQSGILIRPHRRPAPVTPTNLCRVHGPAYVRGSTRVSSSAGTRCCTCSLMSAGTPP